MPYAKDGKVMLSFPCPQQLFDDLRAIHKATKMSKKEIYEIALGQYVIKMKGVRDVGRQIQELRIAGETMVLDLSNVEVDDDETINDG